jgi:hypothetical protein
LGLFQIVYISNYNINYALLVIFDNKQFYDENNLTTDLTHWHTIMANETIFLKPPLVERDHIITFRRPLTLSIMGHSKVPIENMLMGYEEKQ